MLEKSSKEKTATATTTKFEMVTLDSLEPTAVSKFLDRFRTFAETCKLNGQTDPSIHLFIPQEMVSVWLEMEFIKSKSNSDVINIANRLCK